MPFLFSSQNAFGRYCRSASAPLVGEWGDFKPGTSCCSTVPARDAQTMTCNKILYFTPVVSSGPPCAIPTHTQKIPPPAQRLYGETFLTSFWGPMQRSIINYSQKYRDCILKSTKPILRDLKWIQHLSSSRDSAVGAEPACARCGLWSRSLCQPSRKEMGAEVQMGWGKVRRWSVPNRNESKWRVIEGPYINKASLTVLQ